jgi:hypothetical protein
MSRFPMKRACNKPSILSDTAGHLSLGQIRGACASGVRPPVGRNSSTVTAAAASRQRCGDLRRRSTKRNDGHFIFVIEG